jgi:TonB family protein
MKTLAAITMSVLLSAGAQAETPAAKAQREAQNFETLTKFYPARARAAGEQGLVGFTIRLDTAGQPTSCEVTHSSGHRLLDEETCSLVLTHAVFQAEKDAEGNKISVTREGVINWKIAGAAAAPVAAPVLVTASTKPEKMICKRALRSGSLAGYERTCMPKREWLLMSDQMKQPYEDLQGAKGFTNGL